MFHHKWLSTCKDNYYSSLSFEIQNKLKIVFVFWTKSKETNVIEEHFDKIQIGADKENFFVVVENSIEIQLGFHKTHSASL